MNQRVVAFVFMALVASRCAMAHPLDLVWIEPTASTEDRTFTPNKIVNKRLSVESIDDKLATMLVPEPTQDEPDRQVKLQVAASRVIWIEPEFSEEATREAIKRLRSGDAKASIAPMLEAINGRPVLWRAQWLSMHLWQAAFDAQRYPATLELVDQIDARPLPPMILGGLPIHWDSERLPPAATMAAKERLAMADARDASRLVAASWLLGQPDDGSAVAVVESLATQNDRPQLARLAKAMMWRKLPPPAILENRPQWQSALDSFPMTMRPGPTLLLADRLQAAGDTELALEFYLSLALTSPRRHPVAAMATTEAERILRQSNRSDEADRLGVARVRVSP
jgi:hypothetical protein